MWCDTGDGCAPASLVADPVQRVLSSLPAVTLQAAFVLQATPTTVRVPGKLIRSIWTFETYSAFRVAFSKTKTKLLYRLSSIVAHNKVV